MIIADKDETNIEFPVNSNNLEKLLQNYVKRYLL